LIRFYFIVMAKKTEYMRNTFTIILGLLISINVFGTAQIADILIYNNDTIRLYSNPLESFYNNENPRPTDFGISGCWSTACWRGYQATWEVIENKLYLIEIADCCFWEKYVVTDSAIAFLKDKLKQESTKEIALLKGKEFDSYDFKEILKKKLGKKEFAKNKNIIFKASLKPRQNANLSNLFGEHCKNGKVLAFWFTGDLIVPKGKLVEYVHMGYMSKYEKELVLNIENGILIDAVEYENKTSEIEKGYGILQATSYNIVVPLDLVNKEERFLYTMTDTISFSSTDKNIWIEAFSKFNSERKTFETRKILVEGTIDSLSMDLSKYYMFSDMKTEKLRWGTASWVDGFNEEKNERIRIFSMSNINSQVIIQYKERAINEKDFKNKADYITYSVRLMEFGY
jgi:hypothetical protein